MRKPKRVGDYGVYDWLRLRPLLHRYKRLRYRIIDELYCTRAAKKGNVRQIMDKIAGKDVVFTIAYNDPEVISIQWELFKKFMPSKMLVIVDNSNDPRASNEIHQIAEAGAIDYIKLPDNPWDLSRSHGLAMNWVWRNVLRPANPNSFGFIDHDLFPIGPTDPFKPLETQPFYGYVRMLDDRWFLWAGFCFFKFEQVKTLRLDFGQDWFIGLDTGGGNWKRLYKNYRLSEIRIAGIGSAKEANEELPGWRHEGARILNLSEARERRMEMRALVGETPIDDSSR